MRLQPATDEEKLHYASLYTYLSKKNRLGVVGGLTKAIKDFYILPLASTDPIPSALLPFSGPGEADEPSLSPCSSLWFCNVKEDFGYFGSCTNCRCSYAQLVHFSSKL